MKMTCILFLILAAPVTLAQETFKLEQASRDCDVEITGPTCGGEKQDSDQNKCSGPARISLYRKGSHDPFQVLKLANVELYKDSLAFNPAINKKSRGMYEEEYSVVFDDFDFDGKQDIAICNGRNGGYGGPSYDVFLFDLKSHTFTRNRSLSRLTEGAYLGLFFPDAKKKLLAAYSKSGCCYHETEKYRMVNSRPVLVEKIVEDATGEGAFALVTTKRLVNGKWVSTVRRVKSQKE